MRERLASIPTPWMSLALALSFGCAGDPERQVHVDAGSAEAGMDEPETGTGSRYDGGQQDGVDSGPDVCAWVDADVETRPLTVWLVVEHSKVMSARNFGAWRTVQGALVGPDGIVARKQQEMRFGAVRHGGDRRLASCPQLGVVAPDFNRLPEIHALLEPLPEASPLVSNGALDTYALREVRARLNDGFLGPKVVVMVRYSDRHYDSLCDGDAAAEEDWEMPGGWLYDEARMLVESGAQLYVIVLSIESLPTDFSRASTELAKIGNTGRGPFELGFGGEYTTAEQEKLTEALETIAANAMSCEFSLNGEVKAGMECEGEVTIDGNLLPCNSDDGFRMKDPSTVELVGQACKNLRAKKNADVKARFPCEIFVVF